MFTMFQRHTVFLRNCIWSDFSRTKWLCTVHMKAMAGKELESYEISYRQYYLFYNDFHNIYARVAQESTN